MKPKNITHEKLVQHLATLILNGQRVMLHGRPYELNSIPDEAFPTPCETCKFKHVCDNLTAEICSEVTLRSSGYLYIGINNDPNLSHGKDNKRK